MKKHILLFLLLPLITWQCRPDEGPLQGVDLVYRQTVEIPAGLGVFDVHHFYLDNIPTQYLNVLAQTGVDTSQIVQVRCIEGSIAGQFGDANLDFIDKISVRIYKHNDQFNYLEAAYRDPAPNNPGNYMGLIPALTNLEEFMPASKFGIEIVLWLRRTTTESTPLQLDLKLRAEY